MKTKIQDNINIPEFKKYLLTFLLSSITVSIIFFILCTVFDYSLLRSDSLLLFIPTIKDFANSLLSGKGLYYSYNSYMGSGNAFNMANELFSPFNIIFLLFYQSDINIAYFIVIILKIGVAALSFRYFTVKAMGYKGAGSVAVSVFYANCAFSLAFCTVAFMWLDSVIILPLIALGIYKLVKKEKRILLIIAYAYLFITQFYLSYMVGIISFAGFLLYLFLTYDYSSENKIKKLISHAMNYFLCVVISALLSAFVWIPTLFYVLAYRVPDSSTAESLHGSVFSVLNGLFVGIGYGITGYLPYVYCGLPVLILAILYFFNKNIKKSEKIFWAVLSALLVLCMSIKPLNLFLHVFDQPDLMHFRYSFVFSFMLCAIAVRELSLFDKISLKKMIIFSVSLLAFYTAMIFVSMTHDFRGAKDVYLNSFTGLIINALFIALWCVFGFLLLYKEKKFANYLVLALAVIEITVSSLYIVKGDTSNDNFNKWHESMTEASQTLKNRDNGFYRVISSNDYSINSDALYGYNGISDMGDQENYNIRNFLSNIGLSTSARFVDGGGYSPVSNMLTGVKYVLKTPDKFYSSDSDEQNIEIKENEYYLGAGYMVTGNIIFYDYFSRDVFENMNDIVMFMTGDETECFVKIPDENVSFELDNIELQKDGDIFRMQRIAEGNGIANISCTSDYDKVYFQIEKEKPNLSDSDYRVVGAGNKGNIFYSDYASLSSANLMYKGEDGVNRIAVVSIDEVSPKELEFNKLNVYGLDEEALKKQYNLLSDGSFKVTEYKNGYIKGKVNVSDGKKVLFMTIPFDAGWSAYVNGSESHIIRLIDGSFMGLMFGENGEYTVEFKYECPGLKIGIWVSVLGIIAFLSVIYEKKLKNLKIK